MSTHSATNDLFDYIATLDPAEALGELLHQRACYGQALPMLHLLGGDRAKAVYVEAMVPILFSLAERLALGLSVEAIDPVCTDNALHTCTLLLRAYSARATEGGAK